MFARLWLIAALVSVLAGPATAGAYPELRVSLDGEGTPHLRYTLPEGTVRATLLRSTTDLSVWKDSVAFPIASFELSTAENLLQDSKAPQGVELFYQLVTVAENGDLLSSNVVAAWVPEPGVGFLAQPHIMIDKLAYSLYLMDGQRLLRRFPVALGANPTNRKLHFDRASTPEGLYKIVNLQPQAYYHKAFDINYPNSVDKSRYHMSAKLGTLPGHRPDIGGEIQIHGGGIDQNWTWGCIALRDFDMDWLFSRPELKRGVQIAIAGSELRFEDINAIAATTQQEEQQYLHKLQVLGFADKASFGAAVGRFQYQSNLPVTTQLDLKTREILNRYLKVGAR